MDVTVSSMLTMCFYNSLLILLLCKLFKKDSVLKSVGPKLMVLLLLIIIFRLYFPFEFPFSKSIYIEDILSPIRGVLNYSITIKPINITIWRLMMAVWIIVAIILFLSRLINYYQLMRYISHLDKISLDNFLKKYRLNFDEYKDSRHVKMVYGQQYKAPYLIGVRRPHLLLPDVEYEEKEIHYILEHEMMHVRKKDVMWKILIDLLCTFFWWNPVLTYMKNELFSLIELRNDMEVVSKLTEIESVEYMQCLKDMAVRMSDKEMTFGVAFCREDFKELKRRMNLIAGKQKTSLWKQIIMSIAVFSVLIFGACIIIEPTLSKERVEETVEVDEGGNIEIEVEEVTENNTYLVKNGEQYDVYLDGEYIYTTSDITPFKDLKIYKSLKEVKENE